MRNFQNTLKTRKRSFISAFSIYMTVPLTLLTDKIDEGFESGKYTGLILIDLQKAFDIINHEILL